MPEPISDMWWLRPGGGGDSTIGSQWLQGMALGAKMRQENIQNDLARQQLEVMRGAHALDLQKAAATLDTIKAKQLADATRARGMAELSMHLAKVAATNGWGDQANEAKAYQIAANYADVFDKDEFGKIMENTFQKHHEWQDKANAAQFVPKNSVTMEDGTSLVEVSPGHWQQLKGNETIETYTDEHGNQQVRIVRGGSGKLTNPNAPTTAMQTRLQEGLNSAEKALQEGAQVYKALGPESVGVQGQVNKFRNEYLAQLDPDFANTKVIRPQTLLGAYREKVIQAMTAGGDKRISDKDRKYWDAVLPKVTAGESLESARGKINTIQDFIRNEGRVNAKASGKEGKLPFLMNSDELARAVQRKEMTLDEAKKFADQFQIQP